MLHVGFLYGEYWLCYDKIIGSEEKEFWEMKMEHYCLLLPYVREGVPFAQQFAVVFHDWDVIGILWEKILPRLCKVLFSRDVLA